MTQTYTHRFHPPGTRSVAGSFVDLKTNLSEIKCCAYPEEKWNQPKAWHSSLQIFTAIYRPVVITERKDHLELLTERLMKFAKNVIVLRGGMSARQLRAATAALASVPPNEERVLVATGRYLEEGFDDARLDTLFLTMPISWRGTLAQYAGRLHRLHAPKHDVIIYDYVDEREPVLAKMAGKRQAGYRSLGYRAVSSTELNLDEPPGKSR